MHYGSHREAQDLVTSVIRLPVLMWFYLKTVSKLVIPLVLSLTVSEVSMSAHT